MTRPFLGNLVLIFMVCAGIVSQVSATEPMNHENDATLAAEYTFDEMVVSASKTEEAIETIPRHVTVITGEEIRESAGQNIIDLLGRQSGIHIRSNHGTDKHSVVDLRGMGDTAASNVIVMVDGLSINRPDMSGPSISTVPIERIDRIEVVRGAGSVIYGSGAVGGVVNIITRKPADEPAGSVLVSCGSYNTYDARGSVEGRYGPLGMQLSAGLHDSDGYRDNGFFNSRDLDARVDYEVTDRVSLLFSGVYYEDEYGLPGPVGRADIESRSRRTEARYPDDFGESRELRGVVGVEFDFMDRGILTLKRGYRLRDDDYIMGYSDAIAESDQVTETEDDTRTIDLNYILDYPGFGRFHTLQLGMDHSKTEYIRENTYDGLRQNSETESFGVYIHNRFSVTRDLQLNAGTRYNTYTGRFRTDERRFFSGGERMWVTGDTDKKEWNNNAWTLGATYSISSTASVFAGFSTSFRIPNVDEFAQSEEDLRPQEGRHFEVGGRYRIGPAAILSLALFDIRIDDEIYYSDINRNYDDRTIRQGVEADIKLKPVDYLTLSGTYTYTDARFDREGMSVPLVPSHKISGGIDWLASEKLRVSFTGTYTGSVYDGNDLDNETYAKIGDHAVFDAKATYMAYETLSVFAGINNILNNLYSTSAYSEQYYPMPERNVFGGIRWTF